MEKYLLPLIFLVLSICSCKEKQGALPQKQIGELTIPIIEAQNYETALFDLKINADTLFQKGITSFFAVQIFEKKQPSKSYFHSFSKQPGNLKYGELLGKDTIISEIVVDSKPKQLKTEKKWKQIQRKIELTSIQNEENEIIFLVEKEKPRVADTTQFVRIKGKLSLIRYPSKEIEYFDYSLPNKTQVSYIKKNRDTLFQYQILLNQNRVEGKKFTKGLSHNYRYSYNTKGQLTEMIWKENNKKVNATILFKYNTEGLPIRRIIKSAIPAFGNSVTTYLYQ